MVDSLAMALDLPDTTGLVVAVDTETSGLHPDDRLPEGGRCRVAVVTLAWLDPDGEAQARAYPFDQGVRDKLATAQTNLFAVSDPNLGEAEWVDLLLWLTRQNLVFHNAKFDLMFLAAGTRHWRGVDLEPWLHYDTMVGSKTLEPLESVSLDSCEQRHFGTTTKKDLDLQLKADIAALPKGIRRVGGAGNHDLVEWEQIREYAANDARLTILEYYHQQEQIDIGMKKPQEVAEDQACTRALYRIESRGIRYEAKQSLEIAAEMQKKADRIEATLPFAANPEAAKRYFFGTLGLKPYPGKVTDGGKPQLDLEVQQLLIRDGIKHAAEYAEVKKLRTAISMWYSGYAEATGEDGRLRTNYKQTKVKSGRMSVERVQLQAIPKDDKSFANLANVRSLFVPEPGMELWNLDLGQAELRLATHYANCTMMASKLGEGADLHGDTTKEIFGVWPGEGHDYKTCHCDACEDFGVKRDIAKRLTFGGIFQIGPKTFQATLAKLAGIYLPLAECEDIVTRWRSMYPEFGVAYRQSEQMARRQEWVPLVGGRYRSYFNFTRPPVDFPNSAWNRRVQGSLAKFNQLWLVAAEQWLDGEPGQTVLNVHDSLVLEIQADVGQELAREVAERTAQMATELFGTKMTVDVKPWEYAGMQSDYAAFQGALA